MTDTLMKVLQYIEDNARIKEFGVEDFFALTIMPSAPRSDQDRKYTIDCIGANMNRLIENTEFHIGEAPAGPGYTKETFDACVDVDDIAEFVETVEEECKDMMGANGTVTLEASQRIDWVAEGIRSDLPLDRLYLTWFRWFESEPEKGHIEVFYLNDALKKALVGHAL